MKCPACSVTLPDGSSDCPGCGVNFEKWSHRVKPGTDVQAAPEPAAEREEESVDFPVFKTLAACLLVGALSIGGKAYKKYLPNGLSDLAKPSYIKKAPESQPVGTVPAAPGAPAVPAGPATDLSGFNTVMGEYSSKANMLHAAVKDDEARKFFQYGIDDAMAMSFDGMEEAGMPVPEMPFTEEETKRAGRENFSAKCDGKNGTEYLGGLPGNNTEYSSCWQRTSGRAKSDRYIIVIYSPIFERTKWTSAQWLPNSRRWSPWTDAQQAQAAVSYADKHYGMEAIQGEREKTEKVAMEMMGAGATASGMDWRLFETFQLRFRREGLLAGADLLRRR